MQRKRYLFVFFLFVAGVLTAEEQATAQPALSPEEAKVLGFEGEGWSGLEWVAEPVKEGKKAGLWKDHLRNKTVQSAGIPHDWSGFGALVFWMHSAKKTGEQVMLILNSRKDPKVFSYYSYSLKVDWEGWKEVSIPLKKFSPSRDPAGWAKIDNLQFVVDGWGLTPNPESILVLDGMRLTAGAAPRSAEKKGKPEMKVDPARVKAIAALLPPQPTPVLLVPAKDRAAWSSLSPERARALVDGAENRVKSGMTPFSDEDYLDYTRRGKRTGDRMMGARTGHLNALVLGECAEYKGRFLPAIAEAVESLALDKSWTLSAHDGKLDNYEGRKVEVDLSAAARGLLFSGTLKLLEDVLPAKTKETLRRELERRIFAPYRTRFIEGRDAFWWMQGENNWNAVCHAGVVLAALAVLEKPEDRALFIQGAEVGVPSFLHGMPEDGYCTEGIGYWGYGFGNYVLLAMGIREATAGKIDWFQIPKVAAIGRFGRRMELVNESYPAYADCSPVAKPSDWIVYFMDRLYDPARLAGWKARGIPVNTGDPQSACQTLFASSIYQAAPPLPALAVKAGDELRDFYDVAGILNARPKDPASPEAIAVSMKGGHNAEEHNHNDVGSFVVATPQSRPPILLDPGNEVYTARTFSSKRYESKALSSWGHPVPLVGGEVQRPGRDAEGKVLESLFRDDVDRLVLDLTAPYNEIDGVTSVTRAFTYTRSPKVSLRVEDALVASKPLAFGTALLTYSRWLQTGPRTLVFFSDKEALEVQIESGEKIPLIKADLIDEDMGYRQKPTRVGINLPGEAKEVRLALVIRRVDRGALPGGDAANEGRSDRLGIHHPELGAAVLVEAEAFSAQSGGKVEPVSKIGASKLAFKGWDDPGHGLTWTFKLAQAGAYALDLRYCGADDVNRTLFLDGKPAGPRTNLFRFTATGGWSSERDDWKIATLCSPSGAIRFPLSAGEHTVTLVGQGGGLNLDWLRLVPSTGLDAVNGNPSLDDADKDGVPDGWTLTPAPNGKGTQAAYGAAEGKPTLTLTDRDKENGIGLLQIVPVTAGKKYRESARLQGDPINFYFVWLDKDKKALGKELIRTMNCAKGAFGAFSYEETAPEGAAFLRYWIYSARGALGETRIQEAALEVVGN
ncbi:MAG: hypothetical protein J0L75_15790 [Spirochaetes bacterium]|nr:hypothetical protein [Spirochaetota bacterium]